MENLLTYGSDIENGSSSETEENSIQEKNTTDASTSNFFNLELSPQKISSDCGNSDIVQGNEKGQGDKKYEIPDSAFWSGFSPSEQHPDLKEKDHFPFERFSDHVSSRKTAFQNIHAKRSINSVASDDIHCDKRFCMGRRNPETNSTYERRKIFFVHGKVMPGLSVRSVCKWPSYMDSSWPCHEGAINRLSWNILNFSHLVATAGMDSMIKIWNVWTTLDRCISTVTSHSKAVRVVLWGHTGRNILSGSYDKTAAVTDIETGNVEYRCDHDGFVTACAQHPATVSPQCFVTGSENEIKMWDQRRPGGAVKTFQHKDKLGQVQDLLVIQDGRELLSCTDVVARDSADKTIMAWDVRTGVVLSNQIFQERYTCTRLKLHPSKNQVLAQTQGGYVATFSTQRPYKMDKSKRFEGHQMQGYNIGFDLSHDGTILYSGSAEGGIHCYDYRSGRQIRKYANLKSSVITDVACHPVLSSVVAASTWGGHLSVWQ